MLKSKISGSSNKIIWRYFLLYTVTLTNELATVIFSIVVSKLRKFSVEIGILSVMESVSK